MAEEKPSKIDWERIERDYRAGIKTLREMADDHGITHGAINKRAKKEGWVRDLAAKIKAKVTINNDDDQFNKSGFVYVIYLDDTSNNRFYKIGMSSSFNNRFDAHQGSSPFDICVACAYYVGNMRVEERELHIMFDSKRIRGEWFNLNNEDLSLIAARSLLV